MPTNCLQKTLKMNKILLVISFSFITLFSGCYKQITAKKPLFKDPIFDGAADPSVIYNNTEKAWYMFYTNRRANLTTINGFDWVHGTRIGIAKSLDNGISWQYQGIANIDSTLIPTQWAPDILFHNDKYHMYLTNVTGVFSDWGHPSYIVHLTSTDLKDWTYNSQLKLNSNKVIDADVIQIEANKWIMLYNDGGDNKSIYYAESEDLYNWTDKKKLPKINEQCEAPVSFYWQQKWWLLTDEWKGLAVYFSKDAKNWERQEGANLLSMPGTGIDDKTIGGHPDVVVSGDKAFLFYFTHPLRNSKLGWAEYAQRRSVIQVVELKYVNGQLQCDRNSNTHLFLKAKKK
jgi:beta-xylosidase